MNIRRTITMMLMFLWSNCTLSNKKAAEKKDFYNTITDWDIKYVPIIPPFRAACTNSGRWLLNGSDELIRTGKNGAGAIQVNSFGISKNYIYGKTENKKWFLFNIYSLVYSEYETSKELDETLKLLKLDKNIIETCDNYFQQLSNHERCYWYPKSGENYPKFEDNIPDKVYTILVEGKEIPTDFRVEEPIKKTVSKLYYFRVVYGNEKNDLFYLAFDYSEPKLIKKDIIYTACCEDNLLLDIAVYTPFAVAESKGIDDKERIVLSKEFKLK